MKKLAVILVTGLSFGLFASSALAEPSKSAQSNAVMANRAVAAQVNTGVVPPERRPIDRMPMLTRAQREALQAKQDAARASQDMVTAVLDERLAAKEQKIAQKDAQNGDPRGAVGAEMAAKHLEQQAAKDKIAATALRRQARMLRKEALRDNFRLPTHRHVIKVLHR